MAYSGKASQFAYAQGVTVTSANTTATGLIVFNPATSGVNLVINTVALQVTVSSSTTTGIALAYNAQATTPTSTTAATIAGSTVLGGASNNAISYTAATLASAPKPFLPILHNTAGIASTGVDSVVFNFINSANDSPIIVPPGTALSLSALGAATAAAAVTGFISWNEVNVANYPLVKSI